MPASPAELEESSSPGEKSSLPSSLSNAASPLPSAGFLAMTDHLQREIEIGVGPGAARIESGNRDPVAWRFRQTHVPRNDGIEGQRGEMGLYFLSRLAGRDQFASRPWSGPARLSANQG